MKANLLDRWSPRLTGSRGDLPDGATVEILDRTGTKRLGTGTIISAHGTILTCHHVVAGMTSVQLVRHWPKRRIATVTVDLSKATEEFDLALLESGWKNLAPVPLHPHVTAVGRWNARGFQDLQLGFEARCIGPGNIGVRRAASIQRSAPPRGAATRCVTIP